MPQLIMPGNPYAIGIEAALFSYLVERFGFSGVVSPAFNFLIAGAAVTAYNYFMWPCVDQVVCAGPELVALENVIALAFIEYQANALAPVDLVVIGLLTYVYNKYIQTYVLPYVNQLVKDVNYYV